MSYFGIKVGNFYKVGQIYNSVNNNTPFWYFYVNCYEKNGIGRTFYGTVKIVSYQRRMVECGDYVRIDSIDEYRLGKGYNLQGGVKQYMSLVCSLSKSDKEQ